jgi:cell wall-associated NlpC family hydrolase
MGQIAESDLQKADIIVSTTTAKVSGVIRTATGSNISHARLYIGNGEVIEAVGDGVVKTTLRAAMASDTLTIAYRRRGLDSSTADAVVRFAERQIGKVYDYSGAAGAGQASGRGIIISALFPLVGSFALGGTIGNYIAPDNRFFCSELVARAFQAANAPISNDRPNLVQPGELPSSSYLQYVGHLRGGS